MGEVKDISLPESDSYEFSNIELEHVLLPDRNMVYCISIHVYCAFSWDYIST